MSRRSPLVYVLHFAALYKHARHYLIYCELLSERLAGRRASLIAAVSAAGIDYTIARV